MFNKKFFIASRLIVGLIFISGIFAVMYYQQHKEDPAVIEKIEKIKNRFVYSTDENNLYTDETISDIADSLNRIFNPPRMEQDVVLVGIEPDNDKNIIFTYQSMFNGGFADPELIKKDFLLRQKNRFCSSEADLERLQHLNSYRFDYMVQNRKLFSADLTYNYCRNIAAI